MNEWLYEESWNKRAISYSNRIDGLMNEPENSSIWRQSLQSVLGEQAELEVLDIGTGTGFLAIPIAELGHRVTGLDFSEEMVRLAAEKAVAKGLDARFVIGRAEKLPFADRVFDAIVSRNLLQYITNRQIVFEEWLRVLKPGGSITLWDGDWIARNLAPYALKQTSQKRVPSRHGMIKRQGTVRVRSMKAQSSLFDEVAADLSAAGFSDIRSIEQQDQARLARISKVLLTCEKVEITAYRRSFG